MKGCRVYDPSNNTVTTSRDIIIMEKEIENVTICIEESAKEGSTPEVLIPVGEKHDEDENYSPSHSSNENEEFEESQEDDWEPNILAPPINEETPVGLRRTERKPKPKDFENYVTYMCHSVDAVDDPVDVSSAMSRPDKEMWERAMIEELRSFEENEAWELVDAPENATIVDYKWVFKRKIDGENKVTYRARLVARGFSQKPGVDYEETFSPVVRHSTLRLLFSLAAKLALDVKHFDVKTAFLNGDLEQTVYMKQPLGLRNSNQVLKLKKAIYGVTSRH